jgi:hypothetical protein
MRKVTEYWEHAAECRKMAAGMRNPEQRQQLIKMAETWEMLAEERQNQLNKRSSTLEPNL